MNIADAAQYQPLLDSLDAGTLSYGDSLRAKAVIDRLMAYLSEQASSLNNLINSPDAQDALLAGGDVTVAVSSAVSAQQAKTQIVR